MSTNPLRQQGTSVIEPSRETAEFYVECGRVLRRMVRRELEKGAIRYGIDLDIREDRGLLDSVYYVTARGEGAGRYMETVVGWVEENLR